MPLRQDWVIVAEPIWDQVLKGDPITGQVIDAELGSNCHLTGKYQGQGLGRMMLRHLFSYAREQGYESVVLEAPKQTPAFGLYLREGFEVQKEISLPTMPLCMMRRPLD